MSDGSTAIDYEEFRNEVREFLHRELTEELREAAAMCPGIFLDREYNMKWHAILHKQGWVAPAWPKEFGGPGWDITQRQIWGQETALAGAPATSPMGLGMCGPMLIGHGTKEQQDYYLPRILSGEDYWCQGYSEPASGSDLASLALRAETDGEDFVLNGSKIWTTHAHEANRMFCLVRSNPEVKPQQGITFVLLEMDNPGISVQPIVFASGTHEVNQVFFDNVRVPKTNIVGKENDGWTVAKYLLEFERGGGAGMRNTAALKSIRDQAAATQVDDATLLQDRSFMRDTDMAEVQMLALQATEARIHSALTSGERPGPESSIMKNLGADVRQRFTELGVDAAGMYAQVHQPEARTPGSNIEPVGPAQAMTAQPLYFNMRATSIAGGTNEVQKNIVAKLVLGL